MNPLIPIAELSARILEGVGIAIIIAGALAASLNALRQWHRGGMRSEWYSNYRQGLGRAILLGLEFLVAADIIGTVAVEPTFRNLGVLGLIVLIRTFLSFSLEVEITGRWPWQTTPDQKTVAADDRTGR